MHRDPRGGQQPFRVYKPWRVSPNNCGSVSARGYLIISIYGKNLADVRPLPSPSLFAASKSTTLNILPDDAKGPRAGESGFKFTLLNYPERTRSLDEAIKASPEITL